MQLTRSVLLPNVKTRYTMKRTKSIPALLVNAKSCFVGNSGVREMIVRKPRVARNGTCLFSYDSPSAISAGRDISHLSRSRASTAEYPRLDHREEVGNVDEGRAGLLRSASSNGSGGHSSLAKVAGDAASYRLDSSSDLLEQLSASLLRERHW